MDITIYQLLTPLFAIVMLLKGVSRLKRGEMSIRKFTLWILVWGGISVLAVYPQFVKFAADLTGLESGINALIFFGFIFLFYLTFKLFIIVEHLEREITNIVRKKAIEDFKEEVKSTKSKV